MKITKIILISTALIASLTLLVSYSSQRQQVSEISTVPVSSQTLSYTGEKGQNALVLLKKQAHVIQNSSGLVTTINERKADDKRHEYWAFYVNGKMAPVGPREYQTTPADTITWRIDTY